MLGYPATVNSVPETDISAKAVVDLLGEDNIIRNPTPSMASEDFSYMLEKRPGCYVWLGIGPKEGVSTELLHSSRYDFNDDALEHGVNYFVNLVKNRLKPLWLRNLVNTPLNIVRSDLAEVAPDYDHTQITSLAATQICVEILFQLLQRNNITPQIGDLKNNSPI